MSSSCRTSAASSACGRRTTPLPEIALELYVTTVVNAVGGDDWVALRRVLHPYLRFTDEHGRTTRGRTKVIALLRLCDTLDRPTEIELRDGQVYRWCCPVTSG